MRSKIEDLKVCVATSRQWKGMEAAAELWSKIKKEAPNPKFILLFATIDYKDEFKDILSHLVLEFKNTQLAGGTVAGFINQDGCFTRGVTVLAVDYPNMDVAVGIGNNTKRNPEKAGSECAKQIKEGLKNSKWKNGFLFSFISGLEIPRMPGMGGGVIKSATVSKLVKGSMGIAQFLMQKSVGREEDVLDQITKLFPEFGMIHGSTIDNVKMLKNYQFCGSEVLTNSVVCLGMKTDMNFDSEFGSGAKSKTKFDITEISKNNQIVSKINGRPATSEFSRLLKKPEELLFDEKYYIKRFPYFPCGMLQQDKLLLRSFGLVMSDSMLSMSKIHKGDTFTVSITGKDMIEAVKDALSSIKKPLEFGFVVECAIRLMTLGSNIEKVHDVMKTFFREKPFLVIYVSGEGVKKPNHEYFYMNESFAATLFRR
jgi:hypothetical protein